MSKAIKHNTDLVIAKYGYLVICPKEYDVRELLKMMGEKYKVYNHTYKKILHSINVQGQFTMILKMIDEGILENPTPQ